MEWVLKCDGIFPHLHSDLSFPHADIIICHRGEEVVSREGYLLQEPASKVGHLHCFVLFLDSFLS